MKILLALLALTTLSFSTASIAKDFTDKQKAEIQAMFKEYLLNNGQDVIQSVETFQNKKEEASRQEGEERAKIFLSTLSDDMPMTGNKDGDITLVEFFDYNCGYCRRALEELQKVLDKDDNLKVVFFDMPILGPSSMEVSKWSLAAHKQGKYFEYHQALLNHNGQKDEATLEKITKETGLDVEQLKKDKDDATIARTLEKNVEQAQNMNIRGTPGFIIAGKVYPGYMPASRIESIIAEARKK